MNQHSSGSLFRVATAILLAGILILSAGCAALMPKPGTSFNNGYELLKHYQSTNHRPVEVKNQISYSDHNQYLKLESLSRLDTDTSRIILYAAFHIKAAELELKPERITANLYLPRKDRFVIDEKTPNPFIPNLNIPMTVELVALLHLQSPIITPEILKELRATSQPRIYQAGLENGHYHIRYYLDKEFTRIDSITIQDSSNSKIKISYSDYAIWNSDHLPQKTVIEAHQKNRRIQIILNLIYRKKMESEISLIP